MLLSSFIARAESELSALYQRSEAMSIAVRLCEARLGVRSWTHIVEPGYEIADVAVLESDLARLLKGEPLQYVLGRADFYGREFSVAPGVLIPRPETELLVEEVLKNVKEGDRVLDLCTGSGCIAWSVLLEGRGCQVTALDISDTALDIACNQFPDKQMRPLFVKGDVLGDVDYSLGMFDVIVSNPPYIMDKEKPLMHRNVLEYEPSLALFVSDDDPLVFYRAVARWAGSLLSAGGWGIVEINELLGPQTADVFDSFHDVRIMKDLAGKDRFVRFTHR